MFSATVVLNIHRQASQALSSWSWNIQALGGNTLAKFTTEQIVTIQVLGDWWLEIYPSPELCFSN